MYRDGQLLVVSFELKPFIIIIMIDVSNSVFVDISLEFFDFRYRTASSKATLE